MARSRSNKSRALAAIMLMLAASFAWSLLADPPAVRASPAPAAAPPVAAPKDDGSSQLLTTGARARHVHRINLYDETGQVIDPSKPNAPPFSAAKTCGKCHAVGSIAQGWHFNEMHSNVAAGRRGEPWILTDVETGTQLPLSFRGWAGAFNPTQIGLTAWQFVKLFARHMPGGGIGDPGDLEKADKADAKARWKISGALENNCLFCHLNDGRNDPDEWARQIENENFRWAATAAAGIGVVTESAKSAKPPANSEMDDADPANENAGGAAKIPFGVKYDKSRFDANDRIFLDITREGSQDQCYYCHTARDVGPGAAPRWEHDGDIHIRAGMKCTTCHRNDIDHAITRDYPGEPRPSGEKMSMAALSCRGCHMGQPDSASPSGFGGRLAAPVPEHKGLPPLHLDKISCTACHAGIYPTPDAHAVQTSLAHNLGKPQRGRADDQWPHIVGPVFIREDSSQPLSPSNQITPHRLFWPSYWGRLADGKVVPIDLKTVQEALEDSGAKPLTSEKAEGAHTSFTDGEVAKVLAELAGKKGAVGIPVYVTHGKVLKATSKDAVEETPSDAGAPYAWSLAHDVRPASQALGAHGCADCHSAGAPFNYGSIASPVESKARALPVSNMLQLRKDDAKLVGAWDWSFSFRPVFKIVALVSTGLLGLVLFIYGCIALVGLTRRLGRGR